MRNTLLRRPRWVQWVWARALGYSWRPCPECGQMHGGHEATSVAVFVETDDGWFCVCRSCVSDVAARAEQAAAGNPEPGWWLASRIPR
jgi:hypothetical protein